jgi:V/A-type H+-transporting ATPase subunit A
MKGRIARIAGPLVEAEEMKGSRMLDVVYVGEAKLVGEIIKIKGGRAFIQVYEDTTGLRPGEPVEGIGEPLSVELGPGLLSSIYDGVQRPLEVIKKNAGDFITKGVTANALDRKKKWKFTPLAKKGDKVSGGSIIGEVPESSLIKHRILVPPHISGTIKEIREGDYTVEDVVCALDNKAEIRLMHKWPVKKPRPISEKLDVVEPLITGQRVLDTFFPIAKGGTAGIPGPFGAGKTVTQQQLAKWSNADVIVYVGCGERGNEIAEVLKEFPELKDPKSGKSIMERTVLIANTSNMPVAAREASVYTGVTIAEYYRDMGYNVGLMADSTSRWAEAMREISSRLEEMPGEEGYPAYLGSRLAAFYERAGRIKCNGNNQTGSLTIVGAVSPPGGDFSEPVTQNTLRIVRVFWSLDARLADRRHFPAINWLNSYSLYSKVLEEWFKTNVGEDFITLREEAYALLQRESELMEVVQLIGADSLPDSERLVLEAARMIREDFLQQSGFHEVDTYCPLPRQYRMLSLVMSFYDRSRAALDSGASIEEIINLPAVAEIAKLKFLPQKEFERKAQELEKTLR